MNIGLNLSAIQTPHRMRGIGATAINFVKSIPADQKIKNKYILFLYPDKQDEALEILDMEGLNFEVRTLDYPKKVHLKLPGKLRIINTLLNNSSETRRLRYGIKLPNVSDLDSYLEFDQMQPLPASGNFKRGLILYDLIPYIMESDYLWSYKTARQHGHSRKGSLRKAILRKQYIDKLKANTRKADVLFAISEYTKKDFIKYLAITPAKIKVTHLGIDQANSQKIMEKPVFEQYIASSWGYTPASVQLGDKPFLLFVGGADPRRKLNDLVAAYNNLRARGYDIQLVLAGDTMKGPYAIPIPNVQGYIAGSSYLDGIVFLGFVTDEQREWLYSKALAMVYPSVYEGFGLPILEAMQYGTPVITYGNSSIKEIAEEAALYASDARSITKLVSELLEKPALRNDYGRRGEAQSSKFKWGTTVDKMLAGLRP